MRVVRVVRVVRVFDGQETRQVQGEFEINVRRAGVAGQVRAADDHERFRRERSLFVDELDQRVLCRGEFRLRGGERRVAIGELGLRDAAVLGQVDGTQPRDGVERVLAGDGDAWSHGRYGEAGDGRIDVVVGRWEVLWFRLRLRLRCSWRCRCWLRLRLR